MLTDLLKDIVYKKEFINTRFFAYVGKIDRIIVVKIIIGNIMFLAFRVVTGYLLSF